MSATAEILNRTGLLAGFVNRLQGFPLPTDEPTMIYNYNKLMIILQNRELLELEPDAGLVDHAHALATQFSGMTKGIVTKQLTDEQFNLQYDALQARIEEELSGPMYLYARQWGLSVKALYYYKKNRYHKAIDLSEECVILNEYLVKKGVDTLLFRAAEQNKNIVRVLFRQNRLDEACTLTHSMFAFLFNGATEGMHGCMFSEPQYRNRVPYVREGYAYEFFRAMVSLAMNLERKQGQGEKLFRSMFAALEIDITTPDRQIISEWIDIKKKFYDKDYDNFFEALHAFFEQPLCRIYDVIKISLLTDVCSLAQKFSRRTSESTHEAVIFDYIDKHLNGKFYLNTDLSSKNLVSLTA